jgi:hypothetical protein
VGSLGGCGMHALAPDGRIAGRAVAIGAASPVLRQLTAR